MSNYQELLASLAQQEAELQFTELTNETALSLGLALIDMARRQGGAIAVDISRNGQQLFHHAMTGMAVHNAEAIRRKNNVVQRYGHSSYYVETYYRNRGTTFEERTKLDPRDFAADGGAFPLIVKNVGAVGTITVSGLTSQEDHALVVTALRSLLAAPSRFP